MKLFHHALVLAIAAASTGLMAQNFGGQLTISKPMGDLGDKDALDGKLGVGIGGHMLFSISGGHAIVPRVDYLMYKRSENGGELKFNELSIGADYNFYISGKPSEGFYVLAGLGYASGKYEYSWDGYLDYPAGSTSETKGTFYANAGAGMAFTPNFGAELKYRSAKYSYDYDDMTAPALQAAIWFRF